MSHEDTLSTSPSARRSRSVTVGFSGIRLRNARSR